MTDYPQRNLLANALSPYLLQHKDNPVHWREWGEAAFREAKESGRPILLSVGYAACHWCHVMAHESFENPSTAELMNRLFVNIKVDREERPDVDQVYMAALHAMGEQGGWPLTMFLTPEGEPFWGGTYFPPEARYGRPSFRDVLKAIAHLGQTDPQRIAQNTSAISRHLAQSLAATNEHAKATRDELDAISARIKALVDRTNGGIGNAPKFPNATTWECLWRRWLRLADQDARAAAIAWVEALCRGGIYDHLGGGIHRYTVDAQWIVPHFEKMLYDNAQFLRSAAIAHGATRRNSFRMRIEETVACLERDFRLPGGGFASSFDADSEGEEGRYYVWTSAEIEAALGDDAGLFAAAYGVTEAGNWEGRSILVRSGDPAKSDSEREARLASMRKVLLGLREKRVPPGRDDKVLADWNGLAVRGLAEAGQMLARPDWITLARGAFDFVMGTMRSNGRVAHAWRDGRLTFPAVATDLASLINAAVSLYAAAPEEHLLASARSLADELEAWHSDGSGGYYLAASDQSDLPLRARSDQDEAVPSATAMAIEALSRLALVTGDAEIQARAENAASAAWGRVRGNPFGSLGIVNAVETVMNPMKLVTVGEAARFRPAIDAHPDPARIDVHLADAAGLMRQGIASGPTDDNKKAAAYLCHGPVCLPPVFESEALAALLRPTDAGQKD